MKRVVVTILLVFFPKNSLVVCWYESGSPPVEHDPAEDDGVLHQGEEDEQHAG